MPKHLSIFKRIVRAIGILVFSGAVALAVYSVFIQPWMMRWGATDAEIKMPLPGDDLVPNPTAQSTRAITIKAPDTEVWKWLVQIGQNRAGFYSYTFLENMVGADIHNVDRIIPEFQDLKVGDFVRSAPPNYMGGRFGDKAGWYIPILEPNRALVLKGWGAFVLYPIDEKRTRLIIRTPSDWRGWARVPDYLFMQPIHFIMERRMMLGIKQQAEAGGGIKVPSTGDLLWFLSIVVAGLGILGILFSKKWPWTLIVALIGVSLLVLVLFRVPPSPIYGAFLVIAILVALLWAYWPSHRGT